MENHRLQKKILDDRAPPNEGVEEIETKRGSHFCATLEIIGSAHTYYPIREIDSETGDDEVEAADTPIQPPICRRRSSKSLFQLT